MTAPIICMYCGAQTVYNPEVRTPAWSDPNADDPTACVPNAPGHAPVPGDTAERSRNHGGP